MLLEAVTPAAPTLECSTLTTADDLSEINPFTMALPLLHHHNNPHYLAGDEQTATSLLHRHHLPSIGATLSVRQLPFHGLSFQLWPAASALVSLLPNLPLFSSPRRRILELGSGTGLVGIAAAAILGADVTVTDLGHVVPNLHFNAEANAAVVASHGGSVVAAELKWADKDQMEAIGRDFDLIIGSDLVYHDHLYGPLLETLKYLVVGGEFVMAHQRRWKKESAFFCRSRKMFAVDVLHRENSPAVDNVGVNRVVVYRFSSRQRR